MPEVEVQKDEWRPYSTWNVVKRLVTSQSINIDTPIRDDQGTTRPAGAWPELEEAFDADQLTDFKKRQDTQKKPKPQKTTKRKKPEASQSEKPKSGSKSGSGKAPIVLPSEQKQQTSTKADTKTPAPSKPVIRLKPETPVKAKSVSLQPVPTTPTKPVASPIHVRKPESPKEPPKKKAPTPTPTPHRVTRGTSRRWPLRTIAGCLFILALITYCSSIASRVANGPQIRPAAMTSTSDTAATEETVGTPPPVQTPAPKPVPQTPLTTPSPVKPKQPTSKPKPAAPLVALKPNRLEGSVPAYPVDRVDAPINNTVRVRFDISVDGRIENVSVLEGSRVFVDSVLSALSDWRFSPPADRNGRPLAYKNYELTHNFSPTVEQRLAIERRLAALTAPPPDEIVEAELVSKIAPEMPRRARRSGHCVIRFDISVIGTTQNVDDVSCSDSVFRRSSVRAVENWRYTPKTINGEAVETKGVERTLRYQLTDSRGNIIPE